MSIFAWMGWMLAVIALATAASASGKVAKLEAELKRRGLIDESFGKKTPKE